MQDLGAKLHKNYEDMRTDVHRPGEVVASVGVLEVYDW